MAGEISYYLQNKFINHVLRNTPMTSGCETWLALYTSNPTAADTGTEVSGSGYARAYCKPYGGIGDPFGTSLEEPTVTYNNQRIFFPYPSGSWGNVTHWGLRDAPTAGNLYYYGTLNTGSAVGGLINTGNELSVSAYRLFLSYSHPYLAYKLFNHALNKITYTSPGSSIYGALYYTMPVETSGLGGVEVSGSGYSRQQITSWVSPTSGSTYNSGSITFCTSATNDWTSPVVGMCLLNAPTGGSVLFQFDFGVGSDEANIIRKYDKITLNENVIKLEMEHSEES